METAGGAAIAAGRLANALVDAGCRVTRVVGIPDGRQHAWETVHLSRRDRNRAASVLKRATRIALPMLWESVVRREVTFDIEALITRLKPDVVNVHNIHNRGWPPDVIGVVAKRVPTVWTLHDMWSFTGRCAYSYDCRNFVTGCDATCPTPNEYPALPPNRIRAAWESRKILHEQHLGLVAVCPSQWLAREARAGLWQGHRVEVIPYSLPLNAYIPLDRRFAREALGLPADGLILMTAADDIRERRKGGALLAEAIKHVKKRPVCIVTLGSGQLNVSLDGVTSIHLGYIEVDRLKSLAYSAADIFVHPAPVDNFPNVVIESLACGTPVVGLPIGGLPEMVRPGETGWLAAEPTASALGAVIDAAAADLAAGQDYRSRCRSRAEHEYQPARQAGGYLDLFRTLTERS